MISLFGRGEKMKTQRRNKATWFWVVIAIGVVVIFTAIAFPKRYLPVLASQYDYLYENQYKNFISYEVETRAGLVGSYNLVRNDGNETWPEFDAWTSTPALLTSTMKYRCVRFISFQSGTFRAAEGYEWRLSTSPYGDPCLKLYPSWWPH